MLTLKKQYISGIIHSEFIVNIVPDGRFSASNIMGTTQVVMMDEWTPESLSCEDAKRILQGIFSVIVARVIVDRQQIIFFLE